MAGDGQVEPVEPSTRPLGEAAAVLAEIQSRRQVSGKVVLTPDSRW